MIVMQMDNDEDRRQEIRRKGIQAGMSEQSEREQKVTVAILTHVLHRINEFFDEKREDQFAGFSDNEIATEFTRWLAKKDAGI
jgi:hypothetical protein